MDFCYQAILTAAHCNIEIGSIMKAGSNDVNETSSNFTVKNVINHEDYEFMGNWTVNDISIVFTEEEIKFTDEIYPVNLPGKVPPKEGEAVTMTGWGGKTSFINEWYKYHTLTKEEKLSKEELNRKDQVSVFPKFVNIVSKLFPGIGDVNKTLFGNGTISEVEQKSILDSLAKPNSKIFISDKHVKDLLKEGLDKLIEEITIAQTYESYSDKVSYFMTSLMKFLNLSIDQARFLQEAKLIVVNHDKCSEIHKKLFSHDMPSSHSCLSSSKARMCYGDSGGPYTVVRDGKPTVVGIVSYNNQPEENFDEFPNQGMCTKVESDGLSYDFMTSVDQFDDWIKTKLKEEQEYEDEA